MKLLFLYGLPGVGKLTVANELAQLTGYKLFHNHLTVDLLLSTFEFGSQPFIDLRETIWLSVFESAAASGLPGLIFTFNPENSVRQQFVENVVTTIEKHSGELIFIELTCSESELERRMDTPGRRQHKKLVSWQTFQDLRRQGIFDSPKMPRPRFSLDVSSLTPQQSALAIARELNLPIQNAVR